MEFNFTTLLFYIFSGLTVLAAIGVISSKNPVYSVLWLIFAFFNSAALFLLLGAEMLAMLLVIVYVGAVAILFLFVVMMLNIKTSTLKRGFQAYFPIGLILAAILFLEITAITYNSAQKLNIKSHKVVMEVNKEEEVAKHLEKQIEEEIKEVEEAVEEKVEKAKMEALDLNLESKKAPQLSVDETDILVEVDVSGSEDEAMKFVKNATNAHQIGRVLYTDYILYFQTCGLILFLSMIGAIVLTLRRREGVRKQNISQQTKRSVKDTLEIVKVKTGEGIK